jgi:hypothetical protein
MNDAIYKDDRAGLRVPLPLVIRGVLSPERQCRRQTIPGWPSGHGAVRCAQLVNEDLSSRGAMSVWGERGRVGATH